MITEYMSIREAEEYLEELGYWVDYRDNDLWPVYIGYGDTDIQCFPDFGDMRLFVMGMKEYREPYRSDD